jgi:hypothetical protein
MRATVFKLKEGYVIVPGQPVLVDDIQKNGVACEDLEKAGLHLSKIFHPIRKLKKENG